MSARMRCDRMKWPWCLRLISMPICSSSGAFARLGRNAAIARIGATLPMGTVNSTYVDLADRIQQQAYVPYLLFDGSFDAMPQSIRQMADVLDVQGRGETLAAYAETTLVELDTLLAEIPEDTRPSVYLARGSEGVETRGRRAIR